MLTDAFLGTILHGNTAMLEKKMLFQSLYKWIVAFNSLSASNFLEFLEFCYSFSVLWGFFCILSVY
jgi:hypothetical protein